MGAIVAVVLAGPQSTAATQGLAAAVAHIGVLGCMPTTLNDSNNPSSALVAGLRQAGWIEGQNLSFECRPGAGSREQLAEAAAQLVAMNPDVIAVGTVSGAQALMRATTEIPIVLYGVSDPVGSGLVASLSAPGGNVTGTSFTVGVGTGARRLLLLKDIVPSLSRVAVLYDSSNTAAVNDFRSVQAAAEESGVDIVEVAVTSSDEFESFLNSPLTQSPEAMLTAGAGSLITTAAARARISQFASGHQLPLIGASPAWAVDGALAGYGPDVNERAFRAAYYIDRILHGAKPGDLPVEEPSSFALTVNQTTAQAIGLTIPQSVADQVTSWVE